MDNLGFRNIPYLPDQYTPVSEIDTAEFSGDNIHDIIESINAIPINISSLHSLTHEITIATIPIRVPGSERIYNIDIHIDPTQDFINETIIENIRKTGDIRMLSFSISSREVPITRHAIVDIIEPFPDLCKAIIDKYCDILSYMTKRAEHQKPLLDQRRKTSTEIYTLFYNDPMFNPDLDDEDNDEIDEKDKHEFAPETYDLLTETMINSSESLLGEKLPEPYQIHQRKLKQISDNFRGFQGANKTLHFLNQNEAVRNEIENNIIDKITSGDKEISVDTKYFYMDNGHYLYKDVVYRSAYYDYFKKEIELIQNKLPALVGHIKKKYYALGVGDGSKDFELVRDAFISSYIVLMDGSMKSLQEAEVLFTGNNQGHRGMIGKISEVFFSQNWIDDLLKGNIKVALSTFISPRENRFGMPDIQEISNTFSMFGGTYGNFSPAYKKQFLKNMEIIMNTGDNMILSLFKTPNDEAEIADILAHYSSPEVDRFVKNYFIKLGVPEDKIEVQVSYKNDTVHIDALIRSDAAHPTYINFDGTLIPLQGDTLFTCFESERMNREKMEKMVEGTSLEIIDIVTEDDSPYEMFVIEKK